MYVFMLVTQIFYIAHQQAKIIYPKYSLSNTGEIK